VLKIKTLNFENLLYGFKLFIYTVRITFNHFYEKFFQKKNDGGYFKFNHFFKILLRKTKYRTRGLSVVLLFLKKIKCPYIRGGGWGKKSKGGGGKLIPPRPLESFYEIYYSISAVQSKVFPSSCFSTLILKFSLPDEYLIVSVPSSSIWLSKYPLPIPVGTLDLAM